MNIISSSPTSLPSPPDYIKDRFEEAKDNVTDATNKLKVQGQNFKDKAESKAKNTLGQYKDGLVDFLNRNIASPKPGSNINGGKRKKLRKTRKLGKSKKSKSKKMIKSVKSRKH